MELKMKKIFFLSASDRLNYGDLLFPILFKKVLLEKKIEHQFFNFGLVKSNLTYFNALKTESYKTLINEINNEERPILIIGGGEVLFPTFTTLYCYVNHFFSWLIRRYFFKKIEQKYCLSSLILLSRKVLFPFSPSKNNFKANGLKIFYNAVGGTFNSISKTNKELLIKSLNQSDYISVRDKRSLNSLQNNKVEASLFPDSALIMSNYYTKPFLNNNCSNDFKNLPKKYFILQIGQGKKPSKFYTFFEELLVYSKVSKTKIVLCPIGLAAGHNDYKVLMEINKKHQDTILVYPKCIEDIMVTISNSSCYFGTSLHGLITAQSFNVPFYLFNNNVSKLKSYTNTWLEEFCFDDNKSIDSILNNWNKDLYKIKTDKQKAMVYKNYDLIFSKF
jgi:hypothetical protein